MLRSVHRWIGLVAALFWIVQAVTGALIVFRWEIDDSLVPGARVPVDQYALGERIEAIAGGGGIVSSMWASSMAADRFDIHYLDALGTERVMRVDGEGQPLRDRPANLALSGGAVFDRLTEMHQSLLAGESGAWVVRVSGVVLLTNLALGLRLAWPRAGHWQRSLFLRPRGPVRITVRGWHRVVGLWGVLPALLIVSAGVLLAFLDDLEQWLGVVRCDPIAISVAAAIGPSEALAIALARHPGAKISALQMPQHDHPLYSVRVHASDEVSRNWGVTTVFVNAANGSVLEDHPAPSPGTARGFLDLVYPFHTGQIGGWLGRLVVLLGGVWLITMIGVGILSWAAQRRGSRESSSRVDR